MKADANDRRRVLIYQLMVRHFGNIREGGVLNGTIEENGCGKFGDINDAALSSLREMGFTHLWLTGVLEHASLTAYPKRPADDPLIVKGRAGSPYAIRDHFDVSPDYAKEPAKRLEEFRALVGRCREHGFETLIDFVPNHVARSYQSDVRPELSFGVGDDLNCSFERNNNFYYLGGQEGGQGPPLRLPAAEGEMVYETERATGRVTGNNVRSWSPAVHDWYETVKLNYGHDYTTGGDTSHLPGIDAAPEEVPDTWRKMDEVLSYWQEFGIGGFRADMAHMVPMEFWRWAIARARARGPEGKAFFLAEAYDGEVVKDNAVLRVVTKIIVPVILVFALYVQFHGDYGPGGGFQAGVIFAAGFILYALVFGVEAIERVFSAATLRIMTALGLLLFAGVGFWSLIGGERYLDYDALAQEPLVGQHVGIFLVELGVGITVAAVMITVFVAFAGRTPD